MKKKTAKSDAIARDVIDRALENGASFMYVPRPDDYYKPTLCPGCGRGHTCWVGDSKNYTFVCSLRCGWECPSTVKVKQISKKKKAKKAKKLVVFVADSPEFVELIRAGCDVRMKSLMAERAKFPPTYTKKGKPNTKFTDKMRAHMHEYAFTAEQVREEILAQ